jgi:hypothetical protein
VRAVGLFNERPPAEPLETAGRALEGRGLRGIPLEALLEHPSATFDGARMIPPLGRKGEGRR